MCCDVSYVVSKMTWQTPPDLPLYIAAISVAEYIGGTWAMFITQEQPASPTDPPHGWPCAPLALPQNTPATREANGPQQLRLRSDLIRSAARRTIGWSRCPDVVRRIRLWTPYRSLRYLSTR
jgi:hypothetical protein